jgi:hypothetical protein
VHFVFGPLQEDLKTVIARFKRRSAAAVLGYRRENLALHSRPILGRNGTYSRPILGRSERSVPRSL